MTRREFLQAHGLTDIFDRYVNATGRDRTTMVLRSIMRNFQRYGKLNEKQIKYARDLSLR